jgi:hypothetical protein
MNKPKTRALKKVIPPEFNRKKYAILKGQSAYIWAFALSKRSSLYGAVDEAIRTSGVSDKLKAEVLALLANPIASEKELSDAKEHGTHEDFEKEADGIRYLTMYDMLQVADDHYRYGPEIAAYRRLKGDSDQALIRKAVYLAGTPKCTELTPVLVDIRVDMSASNEILIDDFKQWLRITRKSIDEDQSRPGKHRRSGPMTEASFGDLVQRGVIQYVDLALWAKAFSVRLTASQYAEAIFNDVDLNRRISRLKSRDAPELLDRNFIEMLHGQARSELFRPLSKIVV